MFLVLSPCFSTIKTNKSNCIFSLSISTPGKEGPPRLQDVETAQREVSVCARRLDWRLVARLEEQKLGATFTDGPAPRPGEGEGGGHKTKNTLRSHSLRDTAEKVVGVRTRVQVKVF
eukprot:TRINITY_DN30913_c0_g1_i1.p1 TRINITY_DN30913_c0_g1~~TRINITY_DN30913_c0_g1_i1.p1  ORF type:complete len:117 (+),score=9.28 TRINITY_DN30913_c0_g1_i1:89-439(+)